MVTLAHSSRKFLEIILYISIVAIISSCDRSGNRTVKDVVEEIRINAVPEKPVEVSLSQLKIKECEEIKIYPVKGFSFTNIGSVQILDKIIIIADKITRTVYIFDRSGNFINSINSDIKKNIGQIFIGRSSNNSNLIGILNKETKLIKFFDFNGEIVTSHETKSNCLDFIVIDNANYMEYYPQPANLLNKGFAFKKISIENKPILSTLRNPNIDSNSLISFYYLRSYQDSIAYWEYRQNCLYHLDKNGIAKKCYIFNLGPDRLDFNKVNSARELNTESLKTLSVTRIIESKYHIYMESVDHGFVFFLLYDKNTKQLYRIKDQNKDCPGLAFSDDLFNGSFFTPYDITYDGNFFSLEKQHRIATGDKMISDNNGSHQKNMSKQMTNYALIRIMKY